MKVYKFGGASVKDAQGVRNVASVLNKFSTPNTMIVISAMGKTTNSLEEVLRLFLAEKSYEPSIDVLRDYHLETAKDLLSDDYKIIQIIDNIINDLKNFLLHNIDGDYDYMYDQVVSIGEFLSTKIVSYYLNSIGYKNEWLNALDYLKTDSTYREAKLNWDATSRNLESLDNNKVYITQGFIGSNETGKATTLGREGSDYTGAILAYCLNAESLTIWKDVPGVLNADPRCFTDAIKLNQLSYEEAIELSYYGASVIHPKTLQPLQRKGIPLYVKSFELPEGDGTIIKSGDSISPLVPCYILKKEQTYIQISTKDFAFIDEKVIRDVFNSLANNQIKVNLMQISAISLSLCLEDKYKRLQMALDELSTDFEIEAKNNCTLYTVRHYDANYKSVIPEFTAILMQQIRDSTLQLVVKHK